MESRLRVASAGKQRYGSRAILGHIQLDVTQPTTTHSWCGYFLNDKTNIFGVARNRQNQLTIFHA